MSHSDPYNPRAHSTRAYDPLTALRDTTPRARERATRNAHPTNCGMGKRLGTGAANYGCGFRRCPTCGENKSASRWR